MRVLLASHSSAVTAGAERSLLEIARYLTERQHEVHVAVPGPGSLYDQLLSLGVAGAMLEYGWASNGAGNGGVPTSLTSLESLVDHIVRVDPDVIMTNTSVIPWFAFIARQLGIPHAWFVREDYTSDLGFTIYPDVEQTLAAIRDWSDAVLVPSEYMQRVYRELLQRDVGLIYPTFDPRLADRAVPDRNRGERWSILVCATITPHKNQLEVLEAARILRETRTDFCVTLVGAVTSDAYLAQLHDFVATHDLAAHVQFLPPLADPYPTIASHDVCVVPSRNEPSSRVMVEAMLLGTVVVASDIGGNSEKAGGDARAAILYSLGDPRALAATLDRLLSDEGELRAQGVRGREFARAKYIDRDPLAGLLECLESLASTQRPRSPDWLLRRVAAEASRGIRSTTEASQLTRERDELTRERDGLTRERDDLTRERDNLTRERDRLTQDRDDLTQERDDLTRERAAAMGNIARLSGELEEQVARVGQLESVVDIYALSRSWRVTEPARTAGRLVRDALGRSITKGARPLDAPPPAAPTGAEAVDTQNDPTPDRP